MRSSRASLRSLTGPLFRAWRLSNTLDAGFCVEALDEALTRHGQPEVFNTDKGSQFTGFAFTGRLQGAGDPRRAITRPADCRPHPRNS